MKTLKRILAPFSGLFGSKTSRDTTGVSSNASSATDEASLSDLDRERLVKRARKFKEENENTFRKLAGRE